MKHAVISSYSENKLSQTDFKMWYYFVKFVVLIKIMFKNRWLLLTLLAGPVHEIKKDPVCFFSQQVK